MAHVYSQHSATGRSRADVYCRHSERSDYHHHFGLVLWRRTHSLEYYWCWHYNMRCVVVPCFSKLSVIFSCCLGIALFTYHKYRKSIESTVPLDAHGNPIELDDDHGRDELGTYVELD